MLRNTASKIIPNFGIYNMFVKYELTKNQMSKD